MNRGGNPAQIQRGTRTYERWRQRAAARVYGCLPRPRAVMKEREARALYAGFLLSQEWRGGRGNGEGGAWEWRSGLYSLDVHRVFTRTGKPE
ncbi:MAG: hypothetical protein OXU61_11820 [Gammaproteobacteria bacterium]|nr:hypothetical protein [Gammaproteobacteria bacterium]